MPMYDYRCPEGHEYELIQKIAERLTSECPSCQATGDMIMITPPRIDPQMWTPSAMMNWRRKAEERGRGKDMTNANKTCDETVQREADAVRRALGESKIITSG
jgi:putative FmdB family regulatory protein